MKQYASFIIGKTRVVTDVNENFAACVKRCAQHYRELVENIETAHEVLIQNVPTLESSHYLASAMKLLDYVGMYVQDFYKVIFFIEHAEEFEGFCDESTIKDLEHVLI